MEHFRWRIPECCGPITGSLVFAQTGDATARASTKGDRVILVEVDLNSYSEPRSRIYNSCEYRHPPENGSIDNSNRDKLPKSMTDYFFGEDQYSFSTSD